MLWYLFMTESINHYKDVITAQGLHQYRGFVFVAYTVGATLPNYSKQLSDLYQYAPMYMSTPCKQSSIHYCFGSTGGMLSVLKASLPVMQQATKCRIQIHVGNHIECQYKLMSYGIPIDLFLYDNEGNVKKLFVDMCLDRQRKREEDIMTSAHLKLTASSSTLGESSVGATNTITDADDIASASQSGTNDNSSTTINVKPTTVFDFATDKDVILGRGVPIQSHPGNVKLAKLIEDRWYEHYESSKNQKTAISWEIVKLIKDDGGRFLERETDTDSDDFGKWKICNSEQARYKVSYGFRSLMKKQKQRIMRNPNQHDFNQPKYPKRPKRS